MTDIKIQEKRATCNRHHTEGHTRLIAELCSTIPGCLSQGFPAAHRALVERLDAEVDEPRALPDAYRFNDETQEIEWYEVEVTHHLTDLKLAALGHWWFEWEAEGEHDWLPVLILVNRFGARSRMDLGEAYSRLCLSPTPDSRTTDGEASYG